MKAVNYASSPIVTLQLILSKRIYLRLSNFMHNRINTMMPCGVYIYASMLINSKNGVSPFQSLHQWWFIVNWTLKTSCIGILMKVPGTLWMYFHNCDGLPRPICIHCDWDHTIWTKTRGLVRGCEVLLELGTFVEAKVVQSNMIYNGGILE